MYIFETISTRFRQLLRWVVVCAVLLNVSVPAGAMLERGADGTIQVSICTAQGLLNAWLDVETGKLVEHDDEGQDKPDTRKRCPMASASPLAANAADFTIKYPVRIVLPFYMEMLDVRLVIGQSPARLSARGPPLFH